MSCSHKSHSVDAAASSSSSASPKTAPAAHHNLPSPVFGPHTPIKPKHNIHVATLHLRSHTDSLPELTFFTSFALRSARALGLASTGAISLPTKTSLFTTPRSPFAHKKSQQNFWRKEHKRAIKLFDGTPQVVNAWLAFLRKEAMGGVGMKAQIFSYQEVGWGQKMVAEQPSSLATEANEDSDIKALAHELEGELKEEVERKDQAEAEMATERPAKEERKELEQAGDKKPAEIETPVEDNK